MEQLQGQTIILIPLVAYVYLQAKTITHWDANWRVTAMLLLFAQLFGLLFVLRFDPTMLADGIVIGSSAGIAGLCALWALRRLFQASR